MLKSLRGYNVFVQMANGTANSQWVEYPTSIKVTKWICFLTLIGVVLTFVGSFVPAYNAYGLEGVIYALTNLTNLIFLPITLVCVLGLTLKG